MGSSPVGCAVSISQQSLFKIRRPASNTLNWVGTVIVAGAGSTRIIRSTPDCEAWKRIMNDEPTNRSAAVAGIWSAVGLVPCESWMDHHAPISVLTNNIFWLIACAVFLAIPSYFLVIGRNTRPFSRTWFLDAKQRSEYAVVSRRMLSWFLSCAISGILLSSILSFLRIE